MDNKEVHKSYICCVEHNENCEQSKLTKFFIINSDII